MLTCHINSNDFQFQHLQKDGILNDSNLLVPLGPATSRSVVAKTGVLPPQGFSGGHAGGHAAPGHFHQAMAEAAVADCTAMHWKSFFKSIYDIYR